jgi:DNA-binding NtrC family response regulator
MKYAVICIDDDPSILQMVGFQINKLLDTTNSFIEFFTDPELAHQCISDLLSNEIEIVSVIIDYQMPGYSGAQFIRKVKREHPNLYFIMLSGQANAIQVNELVEENLLDAFIMKPWDEDSLVRLIKPSLEKKYFNAT